MELYTGTKTRGFLLEEKKINEVSVVDSPNDKPESWFKTDLDSESLWTSTQLILSKETKYLEATNLALGFNPEQKQYTLEQIKEQLELEKIEDAKSLRNNGLRILRYSLWEEKLDHSLFEGLQQYNPFDEKAESWNLDALENLPIDNKIEKKKILDFITPKKNISYKEAEFLLKDDPNTLISAMTVLTRKYQKEVELTLEDDADVKHFLFTEDEETVFFTGLTLLNDFNNIHNDAFVKELIKTTKGIICEHNTGLINYIIHKQFSKFENYHYEDLLQKGRIGLLIAMDRFDMDLDNKFSTYATWWVRKEIIIAMREFRTIKFPSLVELYTSKIDKAIEVLQQGDEEIQPSVDEIIKYCEENGVQLPKKEEVVQVLKLRYLYPLDKKLSGETHNDADNFYSRIASKNDNIESRIDKKARKKIIKNIIEESSLSPVQEKIITMYYGLNNNTPKSLLEIRDDLDIPYRTIRSERSLGFKKIKQTLGKRRIELSDLL